MNQSFQASELIKHRKQLDMIQANIEEDELLESLQIVSDSIVSEDFQFEITERNEFYTAEDLEHRLVLRKLNDNIKRIYKDEQANRRIIISQIKTLLSESCPFWVLKTDISSFYESIDQNRILAKIQDDAILSYESLYLLKSIFNNEFFSGKKGVPRGLNVSATMSEMYMRKFDQWIKRHPGVYYYARFVDDIIIFVHSRKALLELQEIIDTKLRELTNGLRINKSKTKAFDGVLSNPNRPLEYLGYSFTRTKNKRNWDLKVSIANKKVNKIKTRIVLSVLDFLKNQDFQLLEKRMKFLTGNYSIRKGESGNDLRAGIFFNYSQITEFKTLDELNTFYRRLLFSKNKKIGRGLVSRLSNQQKNRLKKYCFKTGFSKRVHYSFRYDDMVEIVKCW
jgi:hypothetical protein